MKQTPAEIESMRRQIEAMNEANARRREQAAKRLDEQKRGR